MAKKQNLRTFLRSEVLKSQIRSPNPTKTAQSGLALDGHSHPKPAEDGIATSDTDSLFGDPILSREKISEIRLQEFLSRPAPTQSHIPLDLPSVPVNPRLQSLKDELKYLVCLAKDTSQGEKELMQRQRAALVEEISRLERETKIKIEKDYKAKYVEKLRTLPEPISKSEKQQLIVAQTRLEKTRQGQEKSRKRERIDEDIEDLDGEDRFRLGMTKKRRPPQVTGRWQSSIHDYLPGLAGKSNSGEGRNVMSLREVRPEDRVLLRRELMDLGKKLSEEERKLQRSCWGLRHL